MAKKVTADDPSLVNQTTREEYNKLQASFVVLEAKFNALLAKMDTDFTAQNAAVTSSQLDTDYEATQVVTVTAAETVELTQ